MVPLLNELVSAEEIVAGVLVGEVPVFESQDNHEEFPRFDDRGP